MDQQGVASSLETILKRLEKNQQYPKSDLISFFQKEFKKCGQNEDEAANSANDLFETMRERVQQNGTLKLDDNWELTYGGKKKARKYWITNSGSDTSETGDTGITKSNSQSAKMDNTMNVAVEQTSNDPNEDWIHLEAHIALAIVRSAVGISLPKLSSKARALWDNPDIIGLVWRADSIQTLACEVKPILSTQKQLIEAVFQASNQGRHYDESWLLAPISERLFPIASELGPYHNVGIICWPEGNPTNPIQLAQPTRKIQPTLTHDQLKSRLSDGTLEKVSRHFDNAKTVYDNLLSQDHTIYESIVSSLLTDQVATSMVRRLPEVVQTKVRTEQLENSDSPRIKTSFSEVIVEMLIAVYNDAEDEVKLEALLTGWLDTLNKTNNDILSSPTKDSIRTALEEYVNVEAQTWQDAQAALKSAKENPNGHKDSTGGRNAAAHPTMERQSFRAS